MEKEVKRNGEPRLESVVNLHCVVLQMWKDVKKKRKSVKKLSITDYNKIIPIGNIAVGALEPYITQEDYPTKEQMV